MPRPRTRAENKDPCTICGKIVKYKSDVARHDLQHAHNVEELKTRCPWPNCNYRTLQKSNVSTHMIRTHGRKKVYFCTAESSCTFSALDQQSVDRHKRLHGIEDETPSPTIPKERRLNTKPDVTESTTPSSAATDQGFTFDPRYQPFSQDGLPTGNVDPGLVDMLQFNAMPPNTSNPEAVAAPSQQPLLQECYPPLPQECHQPLLSESYKPLSQEEYHSISQCLAEMSNIGTVPQNAPNPQVASAVYKYGRQYAPRNDLASCSIPAWLQPYNNPAPYNAYYQHEQHEQQQNSAQQPLFLPKPSWDYISPPSSSSSSSGASSLGDYPPDYNMPLQPSLPSFGDCPPDYGVPLEPSLPSLGDYPPDYGVPLEPSLPSIGNYPTNYGTPFTPSLPSLGDYPHNYGAPFKHPAPPLGDYRLDSGVPLGTFPPPPNPSGLYLNATVQGAPACQYDDSWHLPLRYEMPGASSVDAISTQRFQLNSF